MTLTNKELERLTAVAADWDLEGYVQPKVPEKYRLPEALLHEISHAVSLGLRVDRTVPERVAVKFAMMHDCNGGQNESVGTYGVRRVR